MKIAIEGCAHGELENIYNALEYIQNEDKIKVDLLICCGDFQAVRNNNDLRCMAVPPKFQKMNSFYKYYSGEKVAPVLTIFIGGNHEASNYLGELAYGGWVCPNIYYMGYSNVLEFGGLRIAGLSGIYKGPDYLKGHFECPPYSEKTKRSIYHTRSFDVFRLKQVSEPITIFVSHDWPRGIYHHGNKEYLLRRKPYFREEVENNSLGSRASETLLHHIQPMYWFAAHLHVKFAAVVAHSKYGEDSCSTTRFLALDKCLPKREFLQILDIPHKEELSLELNYDPEWLCILRSTNHLLSVTDKTQYMPGPGCDERWDFKPTPEELTAVRELFNDDFRIPHNFEKTVEPYDPNSEENSRKSSFYQPTACVNPQTTTFCCKLGISDPIQLLLSEVNPPPRPEASEARTCTDPSEANITLIANDDSSFQVSKNPEEFQIDADAGDGGDDDNDSHDGNDSISGSCNVSRDAKNIFYIDKSSSGLHMPSKSSSAAKPEFIFPKFNFKEDNAVSSSNAEISTKTENSVEAASDEEPKIHVVKKFKRRNQSIYESKADDDEDN